MPQVSISGEKSPRCGDFAPLILNGKLKRPPHLNPKQRLDALMGSCPEGDQRHLEKSPWNFIEAAAYAFSASLMSLK